jgi:hypothetical protein
MMDLTTRAENTRGMVTPVPLTETVKKVVEAMVVKQGITSLKFTNKKGQTLEQEDLVAGVDYDTIGDYEETEEHDDDLAESLREDPVVQAGAQTTNGELVKDEEENPENQDIELVINEMIDELSNEILPRGEELLNDPEEEEQEESTGDPVEQLLCPRREIREPEQLTYSQVARGLKQD